MNTKLTLNNRYNVAVIGGGTAGLVTSAGTVGLGGRAALVEANKMGGDCLNYGCVPSKALISSTKLIAQIHRSRDLGLTETAPSFKFEEVFERMRERRATIEPHDSVERFESLGVDVFQGRAKFVSPFEITIDDKKRLTAKHFVIATGSKTFIPSIPGLDSVPFYTNETIFDNMQQAPLSMMIIGGGPIGCELAQVMGRLGVAVKLIERLPRLIHSDDRDASALIKNCLEKEGIEIHTATNVTQFEYTGHDIIATVEKEGQKKTLKTQAVLLATGRQPNIDNMGLDNAGVDFDHSGIKVNSSLTTSKPNIYACGDVVGPYLFTHSADYQARIVTRNILIPWFKAKVNYQWVPRVTYTDPEVAHFGLTEDTAKQNNIPYNIYRYDWNNLDRAITDSATNGFIKVLTKSGSDKILGATIVGVHAGEVMHEVLVAAKHGIGLSKLSNTIHAYPTFSSSVQRVADVYQKTRLTPFAAKLFKWLYRWNLS